MFLLHGPTRGARTDDKGPTVSHTKIQVEKFRERERDSVDATVNSEMAL